MHRVEGIVVEQVEQEGGREGTGRGRAGTTRRGRGQRGARTNVQRRRGDTGIRERWGRRRRGVDIPSHGVESAALGLDWREAAEEANLSRQD